MTKFVTAFALLALTSCATDEDPTLSQLDGEVCGPQAPRVTTIASGLTNPRGMTIGPDGLLYFSEAGTGGSLTPQGGPECTGQINIYTPYTAGYTGKVSRIKKNGQVEVLASGLPSMTDVTAASYGPTDVAFVDGQLYTLIEMGGCVHALPETLPAVLRINPNGTTTNVANLNAWLAANPPHWLPNLDPTVTDIEPGGVFHSMVSDGKYLYIVETNHSQLVRVNPKTGEIKRLYDLSRDEREHNPIAITKKGNSFFVGTFGEESGPAEIYEFDKNFHAYTERFASQTVNPITGLAFQGNTLYGVEMFDYDNQWVPDTGNLIRFRPNGTKETVLSDFASFPLGLISGPDNTLYTANWGLSFGNGDGSILKIRL